MHTSLQGQQEDADSNNNIDINISALTIMNNVQILPVELKMSRNRDLVTDVLINRHHSKLTHK